MWVSHTSRDLPEQRLLDFLELCWLNDIQNLLNFTQEHHLIEPKMEIIKWTIRYASSDMFTFV